MINIQNLRIQWAKTKHYLKWVVFAAFILQVALSFPVFLYLFNFHLFNKAIYDSLNPKFTAHYSVNWGIIFLDAVLQDWIYPAVVSFIIYPIIISLGMWIVFKINSDSAPVKATGEDNQHEKYTEGARFRNIKK